MSKLISIEKPKRGEGGDAVFVRQDGRRKVRIQASFDPNYSWSQWGATTELLGDNVAAVEAWAEGMRNAYEAG